MMAESATELASRLEEQKLNDDPAIEDHEDDDNDVLKLEEAHDTDGGMESQSRAGMYLKVGLALQYLPRQILTPMHVRFSIDSSSMSNHLDILRKIDADIPAYSAKEKSIMIKLTFTSQECLANVIGKS
ncbi:hypothetical protein L7F22_047322 [Adiantum nelumboides]|nr:hypothetical protein [Adiantum nelumboides]